jgi:uncharacterized Zn-binding protein involved in type VI secretion
MPAAARQGDSCVIHCSPFNVAAGSASVFTNGRAAARVGDPVDLHLNLGKKCFPHSATIASGSRSVFINGKAAARVGSKLKGCTSVSGGSGDVFIGG